MKKVSLALALLLALTVFGGLSLAVAETADAGKAEPKRFGIIGAMDEEIASLTEAMTESQIRTVAGNGLL